MNLFWTKYLPWFVRDKLDQRFALQRVMANGGWLLGDKILRMIVGLFVGAWVARYLGPEKYGLWNFAIAFTMIFGTFATLGLDSILVRELVRTPYRENELMGTVFVLRISGSLIAFLFAMGVFGLMRRGDGISLCLVALSAGGFIFQSWGVIDLFFQSKIQSKYAVYAAHGAFVLTSVFKIFLVVFSAPLVAFAVAGLTEFILTAIFLIIAYMKTTHNLRNWVYRHGVAKELLADSWPLVLAGIAVTLYMRIDQIMVGQILDNHAVGLYSAAVRINELWYYVPMTVVSSIFPILVTSKKQDDMLYANRLRWVFKLMVWVSIGVALVTTLASTLIIKVMFGDSFKMASKVLSIHAWSGVFGALGMVGGMWYTAENLQKYTFYRTLMGCGMNIVFNLYLIPSMGINGAAIATIVSQGTVSLFFDALSEKTRPLFWMKLNAFNPFYR